MTRERIAKIKELYIDSYSDFSPNHYANVIEEILDAYESVYQDAKIVGRTEAMDFIYVLSKEWREMAEKEKRVLAKEAWVWDECADQLEKQIDNFSTFC